MTEFPTTATDFYALRDERTNRCEGTQNYQLAHCAVRLSPEIASTLEGQTMLLVAANLLSRWCRRVTIVASPVAIHPVLRMGDRTIGDLVLDQMLDADPFGEFEIASFANPSNAVELQIGSGSAQARAVSINASGWLSSLSLGRSIELPAVTGHNTLGAVTAACLGVAQVFKIAVGLPRTFWFREGVFDLFDLGWTRSSIDHPWPESPNIGKILMVGAGSVGSAAAYCARLAGLAASLSIIDRDVIKIENFNRSPIFGRRTFRLEKAAAVASFLSSSSLRATPVLEWWNEFLQSRSRVSMDFDIWLPLANERGVRGAMQHNIPPLMIHASTTANWGVNHGRHIPGRDDCLLDRFEERAVVEALTCSSGRVPAPSSEEAVDAALPFASVFAGALIVADLVRAQLTGYPQVPNFALFDLYSSLEMIQSWDRRARADCSCRGTHSLQSRFNRDSRYYALGRAS